MDPITNAARAFLEQAEACWKARPNGVLRLVVAPEYRRDLIAALRLAEAQPENRRPLFLVETPFTTAESYAEEVCNAIADDQEAVRRGAEEEGVSLAPRSGVATRRRLAPWARIAAAGTSAADALGDMFDGILLALVPERVDSTREWKAGIASLSRAPRSDRARIAVLDLPGEPLASVLGAPRARFEVDARALEAFLEALDEDLAAPAEPPGEAPEAPSDAAPVQLSPGVPRTFRRDLLAATRALRDGRHDEAVRTLEQLREACARGSHRDGELGAAMALAGAHSASGDHERATSVYRSAVTLAANGGLTTLECQAMLGEAASLFAAGDHREAAKVYARAAAKARDAGVQPLAEQAERMERACLAALGGHTTPPISQVPSNAGDSAARDIANTMGATTEAGEITGEARITFGGGPLPFIPKEIDPASLGPSAATRRSAGLDTGTLEFRAVPVPSVLPFQGPRVEKARASFMRPSAEAPAVETETTCEVEAPRILRPAMPFGRPPVTGTTSKNEDASPSKGRS